MAGTLNREKFNNSQNFRASQMPIKQRIQQIDVSILFYLILIVEKYPRWYKMPERQQERFSTIEI